MLGNEKKILEDLEQHTVKGNIAGGNWEQRIDSCENILLNSRSFKDMEFMQMCDLRRAYRRYSLDYKIELGFIDELSLCC